MANLDDGRRADGLRRGCRRGAPAADPEREDAARAEQQCPEPGRDERPDRRLPPGRQRPVRADLALLRRAEALVPLDEQERRVETEELGVAPQERSRVRIARQTRRLLLLEGGEERLANAERIRRIREREPAAFARRLERRADPDPDTLAS